VTKKTGLELLKSKIQIDLVFRKGKVVRNGALIMRFIIPKDKIEKVHIGVGVPKKMVLMAYQRNRIKRQIRAVIRQQKERLLLSLSPGFYMVLYKGKVGVSSEGLSQDFQGLLKHFSKCG
tara:strand:+ start:282 stop:641 length:360 start_codon:yes stop_codon:yes gene_type:complete